jgi:hypothetical protein
MAKHHKGHRRFFSYAIALQGLPLNYGLFSAHFNTVLKF